MPQRRSLFMGGEQAPGWYPCKTVPLPILSRRDAGAQSRSHRVPGAIQLCAWRCIVRYQLKQIYCRPWTLSGLSLKLIESHYENNYGGGLRRPNPITQQPEGGDFAKTPGPVINGPKRGEL